MVVDHICAVTRSSSRNVVGSRLVEFSLPQLQREEAPPPRSRVWRPPRAVPDGAVSYSFVVTDGAVSYKEIVLNLKQVRDYRGQDSIPLSPATAVLDPVPQLAALAVEKGIGLHVD